MRLYLFQLETTRRLRKHRTFSIICLFNFFFVIFAWIKLIKLRKSIQNKLDWKIWRLTWRIDTHTNFLNITVHSSNKAIFIVATLNDILNYSNRFIKNWYFFLLFAYFSCVYIWSWECSLIVNRFIIINILLCVLFLRF